MTDLPKIAMQRLDQQSASGDHPDPNLISAFVENSLPVDVRAQVLGHIAQCGDCREVVFLSSPDQAAALSAPVATPSTWLTWPVLRWGAAVAAVVVVVGAVALHRPSGRNSVLPGVVQMTDAPTAKEKAASAPLVEEKRELAKVTTNAPAPPAMKNDAAADAGRTVPEQLKKQSARVAASPIPAQNSGAVGGIGAPERRDELDKSTTVEVAGEAPAAGSVPVASDQIVPGRAKDAASEPSAKMAGTGGGVNALTASGGPQRRAALLPPVVAPRWTLTSDGTLQRSLDFGRSWQTIQVASQSSFRALAASGRDIWVGGAKAALYHSADAGNSWTQVQPTAAGQALTDDIIGVEFPDSLHGQLTTSGKETWTTEDGGQTWRKR